MMLLAYGHHKIMICCVLCIVGLCYIMLLQSGGSVSYRLQVGGRDGSPKQSILEQTLKRSA